MGITDGYWRMGRIGRGEGMQAAAHACRAVQQQQGRNAQIFGQMRRKARRQQGASQRRQLWGVPRAASSEPAQMPSINAVGSRLVTVLLKASFRRPRALISSSTRVEMQ